MALNLLVVEDEPSDRILVHAALRQLPADTLDASTMAEAIRLVDSKPFDCVVLDWRLPDGTADAFLKYVRNAKPRLPVIVLTGLDDDALATAVIRGGAQDYVVKERLVTDELARAVLFAVERQRASTMREQLAHADRIRSLGTLTAGIAHEINNPATVLMANLEVMLDVLDESGPEGDGTMRELIHENLDSIRRISSLMRQMVGFARLGHTTLRPIQVGPLVQTAVKLAWPATRHRAAVEIRGMGTSMVTGDENMLTGALVNLLVNAQQAIDAAQPHDHRIRVTLTEQDGAVIEVEDSGRGIPDHVRPEVFEPFVTSKSGGTGLGLTICNEIVQSHGGTIRVDGSAELGGARFTVTLPLATDTAEVTAEASAELPSGQRILVVDDDALVRRSLQRLLRSHPVHAVATVDQALGAITELGPPDLILCDVVLAHESGGDLLTQLEREYPELAGRLLFITGGPVNSATEEVVEQRRAPVLRKPFTRTELVEAMLSVQAATAGT